MRRMATAATLAFALVAAPAFADHSRSRGGGGGGSASGSGHPSGGSSSGASSSSSDGSSGSSPSYSGSSGGGRGSSAPLSPAQRRHPRAGTGSGYNYYHGGGYYPGYYPWYPWYYPSSYYYGPYWGSYYYGYWPYGAYYGGYAYGSGGGGGGGGGEAYYQSGGGSYEPASVRVLVDPDDSKVYVDGYYAGKVDQFDGMFQRLHLQRGRHEILIRKDGYQGQRFLVFSYPGAEIKIESTLSKGSGEAPLKDLTGGRAGEGPETRPGMGPETRPSMDDDDAPPSDWPEDGARSTEPRHESMSTGRAPAGERLGEVRLNVRPGDATIYVDGEFRGTARESSTLVLPAGSHRVEVVRPGFRTATREVDVRAGETRSVEVDLDRP